MSCWARVGLSIVLGCLLWSLTPQPAEAATTENPLLTLDVLQERIEHPVRRDGKSAVSLRDFTIDLRPENAAFRDRFYALLRDALQSGKTVPDLDLSNAVIKGRFDIQQLSLREPLYGEAFFPLLTDQEQTQLKRDRQRLSQLSQLSRSLLLQPQPATLGIFLFRGGLNFSKVRFEGPVSSTDVFFLAPLNAQGAQFLQDVNFSESRFSQPVSLTASQFQQAARFRSCLFFKRLRMGQSVFNDALTFQSSEFSESVSFGQSIFRQGATFSRASFLGSADFDKTQWQGNSSFLESVFADSLFLTDAVLDGPISFRQSRFERSANLRGTVIQNRLDFGDASFAASTTINISGADFNADQAELLGSPGYIGRILSVPTIDGNETLLRNLVRNFRQREQIADANQIEYTTERLRLKFLQRQLTGVNLNTASKSRLVKVGFSPSQADKIIIDRQETPFVNPADILDLERFDLATYVKVRDRIIARPKLPWTRRLQLCLRYVALSILLLTSHYGTSVGLTLGVGVVAIALSSMLFWLVDRYRRVVPTPIVPSREETIWMLSSFGLLMLLGTIILLRVGDAPLKVGSAIALVVLPVPGLLITALYRRGRFHDQLDVSYLVEDGSARQLRLLIARLPIIPKYVFFRDRFFPIDWQKRRNWLNYYDFSLNNWFKFGFNDIRLRDEYVPGLVSALVWYQWAVGLAYVTLLLWTFSRTIPGLNLLLYF